jgi:foldase protein PrsA
VLSFRRTLIPSWIRSWSPSGVVALLLLALFAVSCAGGDPNVAATVNGVQISVDQLNKTVDEVLRNPQVAQQLKGDPGLKKSLQIQVLDRLVQTTLIEQAAKEIGVTVTDQQVRARLDKMIDTELGGREAYEQLLKKHGLTEQAVLTELRPVVLGENIKQKLQERVQVSDAQVRQAYADSTRARHILVESGEEARKIKDRLAAGEEFGVLARERSTDETTKENGGDLGFVKRGMMVPQFEQALFAAKPGEVVGPVQTQFGFHVIQRLPEPPFEQVQAQLKEDLLQQQRGQVVSDFLAQQRTKAKVEVNPQFGVWDPSSGVRPSEPLGKLKPQSQTPAK